MVGGGALVVGGGRFSAHLRGFFTGDGLQRSDADLTPELALCDPPPPKGSTK